MFRLTYFFALVSFIFISCEVKVNTPGTKQEKPASKIRNGIHLKESGLKVEQAFLLRADGSLIPDDNKIKLKERIKLRLIISGWKDEDGKVSIGASERVMTSANDTLLNESDLFAKESLHEVRLEDARYINLSFSIDKVDELYDYFLVEFIVWDKNGGGDVSGSYRVYLE